ncbi:MAG TPA: toxic anion resistance protein, partial [Rhodobacteraceae bacterium]|nr:toxic anion resistance protein [Paracoccaceae bacterium]
MTGTVQKQAQATLAMVEEVNAVLLPEPAAAHDIVPLEKAKGAQSEAIRS